MAGTSASFSRTGLVIQSLAVPGLGLARVTGKPHWLRAVAGYGCIAGSVVLNQRGISLFESVDDIAIPDRAETVFKRSVRCDNLSEALAITALGIWIADAVWTWAGTKDFGNVTAGRSGPGLVLGTGFEPISNIPVISFRFNLRK